MEARLEGREGPPWHVEEGEARCCSQRLVPASAPHPRPGAPRLAPRSGGKTGTASRRRWRASCGRARRCCDASAGGAGRAGGRAAPRPATPAPLAHSARGGAAAAPPPGELLLFPSLYTTYSQFFQLARLSFASSRSCCLSPSLGRAASEPPSLLLRSLFPSSRLQADPQGAHSAAPGPPAARWQRPPRGPSVSSGELSLQTTDVQVLACKSVPLQQRMATMSCKAVLVPAIGMGAAAPRASMFSAPQLPPAARQSRSKGSPSANWPPGQDPRHWPQYSNQCSSSRADAQAVLQHCKAFSGPQVIALRLSSPPRAIPHARQRGFTRQWKDLRAAATAAGLSRPSGCSPLRGDPPE